MVAGISRDRSGLNLGVKIHPSFLFGHIYRSIMSRYGKTNTQRRDEEFVAQTRARLETIRSHLETAPRSGKLKGKTCVITGAGSLKGIGSVPPSIYRTSLTRL